MLKKTFSSARLIAFLFLSFLIPLAGVGQHPHPDPGLVFDNSVVPRIDILIHPDSLFEILKPGNEESDHEFPAIFIFSNGTVTDTLYNIGFRLRGNTSRYSQKKSFKVSFNSFESSQKYYGLEKMNLNGEHNDPSVARSKICWELHDRYGVIGSRSNHVQLYVNQEYRGLYINVEHVDEEYVNLRFGNKNGNLYKCLWPAPLTYLGSDPDLYKYENGSRRAYDLKTNEIQDDYSDLAELIRIINKTSPAYFPDSLEPIFNVNEYLKFLAFEIASGHWDSYSYNQQNYYLYKNTNTGQFEFIPYDIDNTLGIDWMGIDWGTRNIYQWAHSSEPRPLTKTLLQNPEYRNRFSYYMNILVEEVFNESFFTFIDSLKNQIAPYAETDIFRTLDYGYDYDDFLNSFEQPTGAHVFYGIKPYINQRMSSILQQLDLQNITPIINEVSHNSPIVNQDIEFEARVQDDDDQVQVILNYKIGQGSIITQAMTVSSSYKYSCMLPGLPEPAFIDYYINAIDPFQHQSRFPRIGWKRLYVAGEGAGTLSINELLASNLSYGSDEAGDFDDWIELVNYGNDAIFLGDKYLTDNPSIPDKWQFPQMSINPGQYLLVWADDETDEGPLHTSFKLDKAGEFVGIYHNDNGNFMKIDEIQFGQQETDISYGRIPDATGEFIPMSFPTPGTPNSGNGIGYDEICTDLQIFPNPSNGSFMVSFSSLNNFSINLKIFDLAGRQLFSQSDIKSGTTITSQIITLKKGCYIVDIKSAERTSFHKSTSNAGLLIIQ